MVVVEELKNYVTILLDSFGSLEHEKNSLESPDSFPLIILLTIVFKIGSDWSIGLEIGQPSGPVYLINTNTLQIWLDLFKSTGFRFDYKSTWTDDQTG